MRSQSSTTGAGSNARVRLLGEPEENTVENLVEKQVEKR